MTRCLICSILIHSGSYCERHQRVEVPLRMRLAILNRDNHQCQLCGAPCPHPRHHDIDHIVPWSQGGQTILANLRTRCTASNRGRTTCQ